MILKKIISILLIFVICIQSMAVVSFASADNVYVNETFDSTATNGVPAGLTVRGSSNSRVVEDTPGNKVMMLDLSLGIASVSIPISPQKDTLWLGAKVKIGTKVNKANLFSLKDTAGSKTNLLSFGTDGGSVSFNKSFSGIKTGIWQDLAVMINYKAGTYSIYIDGKQQLSDWKFQNNPNKSASFEFEFIPLSDKKSESFVWIDDVRAYDGSKYRTSFDSQSYNPETIKFEAEEASEIVKFYKQLDFNDQRLPGIQLLSNSNPTVVQAIAEENGRFYFRAERAGGAGGYHNILIDNCDSYFIVIDFDVCVYENSGTMTFMDMRAADQRWNQDFELNGSALNVKKAGSINLGFGVWNNLAFCYNLIEHTFDVYHNDRLVYENVAMHNMLDDFIYARTTLTGNEAPCAIGYDNIYIYEGENPLDDVATEAANSIVSQFEGDEKQVHDFLGDSVAFSVTSGDVYNGETKVESLGAGIIENDRTLVPVRTLSEAFGIDVEWNADARQVTLGDMATLTVGDNKIVKAEETIESDVAPNIYNDRVYLPLRVLAEEVLGKAVYWDQDRKLVIMQDGEVTVNTRDATNMDMAYRYLMYDRLNGEEMIKIISEAPRPRLIADGDHFQKIINLVNTHPRGKAMLATVQKQCDEYMKQEPIPFTLTSGGDIYYARGREEMALRLGLMYKITGDEKYAERLWAEMEQVCSYPHWGRQYLNISALLIACSLTYDWLDDWLTDEQRTILADAMVQKGLLIAKKDFSGQFGGTSYIRNQDNWTAVCNSGIIMACVTIGDREEYSQLCADVFESAQVALEYIFKGFEPDGGWREGLGYYSYTTIYLQKAIATMDNVFGTTFGYTETPGFRHAGWFYIDMTGPMGVNNMGDAGKGAGGLGDMPIEGQQALWWSAYYKEPELTAARFAHMEYANYDGGAEELLYMNTDYIDTPATSIPLDCKYSYAEYLAMRGNNWVTDRKNAMWLSAHAGINSFGHGHSDAGTFVFDALGERWALDLGSDDYSLPEWGVTNDKYYCIRAEGHNVCVINPDESYGQLASKEVCPITEYESMGERGSYAIMDLKNVYSHRASSAKRGFSMMDGRKSLTIRDEFNLNEANSEIYWFMHTRSKNIQIFNNYAILEQNGKQLRVDFITNADSMEICVMDAAPMETSPQFKGTVDYTEEFDKLTLKAVGSGEVYIVAKLTPLDGSVSDFEVEDVPLSAWGNTYKN